MSLTTNTTNILRRYLVRGQLRDVYALHPNPLREGRSLGFIVSDSQHSPLRDNARARNGWRVTLAAPSTKLLSEVYK